MFEASLVESTGQIRTRTRWFAAASFVMEAALLSLFVALPYLRPASLPKRDFVSIYAPPPMPALPHLSRADTARASAQPMLQLFENTRQRIETSFHKIESTESAPGPIDLANASGTGAVNGTVIGSILGEPQPAPHVTQAKPASTGPIRVSSGVATGRLLSPIRAQYPPIARAAHVQGTVVIHALISKTGQVKNAQVLSGSPLLAQAAMAAVSQARYRPYLLSGVPVEVETTINVIFELGN